MHEDDLWTFLTENPEVQFRLRYNKTDETWYAELRRGEGRPLAFCRGMSRQHVVADLLRAVGW